MEDRDADVAGGVYCISPHEIFSRDLVVGEDRKRDREREREMGHTIRMEYRRLKRHLGR